MLGATLQVLMLPSESHSFFSSSSQSLSSDLIACREGASFVPTPTLPLPMTSPPLQVYQRSKDRLIVPYGSNAAFSPPVVHAPSLPTPTADDLPIALRRGKRTCAQHPIANCVL